MGQQIAVVAKPSSNPGVVRFEANRNLTGQGHEVFHSSAEAMGTRPAAVLARRLLDKDDVDAIQLRLDDIYQAPAVADAISAKLGADKQHSPKPESLS